MSKLYAGTSGFAYATWKPGFYPAALPATRFLDHYATRLNCVEVNYTFRSLASEKTQENWINKTPDDFQFCPKAHMRITHIQKLRNAEAATTSFLNSLQPLGRAKKLGPILFQLPPNLQCDLETLSSFLAMLPKHVRYAFEFRHASWFNSNVYDVLQKHNSALCLAESEKLETPETLTADFVYYRLRKLDYTPEEVSVLKAKGSGLVADGKDVFVFFKHEDEPDGALWAESLLQG